MEIRETVLKDANQIASLMNQLGYRVSTELIQQKLETFNQPSTSLMWQNLKVESLA